MLLTLSIFFHHFLQERMELSCIIYSLSCYRHVLFVNSQICMVRIVQIMTLIMWVDSSVWKEHSASVVMVTESRVRNAV